MIEPGLEALHILGFDYGKRFIGVAVGETVCASTTALGTVPAFKGVPDWEAIDRLIANWRPKALVIGLPLNVDGSAQNMTKAVLKFQKNLHARTGLPCHLTDERLTTYAASKQEGIKNKKQLDAESARIILVQWLEEQGYGL